MKNRIIKLAILTTITASIFISCERELDQVAFNQYPIESAMTSPDNFTQAINGAYSAIKGVSAANASQLPNSGLGYFNSDTGNQIIVPDLTTDNLIYNPQGRGSNFTAYNWTFSANNGSVTGLFTQAYAVIARANMPLKYINNLPVGAFRSNIEANARAIRAAAHFDLVRAYCKIPTQSADASGSLGIPYVTEFNPIETNVSRNLTVAQVYDKIIEDLNFAVNNISTATVADKSKFTKPAIYGLLSRIYLYKGDYNNAITAGNLSISASSDVGALNTFPLIWSSNNSDGVLLKILNSPQENVSVGTAYQQGYNPNLSTFGSIRSEYVVPKSLNDLYATNDIRKSSYIRTSAYQSVQRNHVIKWGNNAAGGTPLNVVEVKYLRTAEVYLNTAEAAYKVGDESLANTLLNNLKAKRYSSYSSITLSGTALWNEIMLQRRLELAFENDRYYTFKRLGLVMQRTGEGANIDGTGTASVVQTIQPGDTRWQWPIPQSTINITPSFQQNPGY